MPVLVGYLLINYYAKTHQYFGKVAVLEGFKEFNEVIGLLFTPELAKKQRSSTIRNKE